MVHRTTGGPCWHIDAGVPFRRGDLTRCMLHRSRTRLIPPFDRGRDIRLRIATPTGITGNMVSEAPYSDPVADEVLRWIRGRVIVAHNARFDRGYPSRQLAEAIGGVPQVERLCTLAIACCIAPRLRHWTP